MNCLRLVMPLTDRDSISTLGVCCRMHTSAHSNARHMREGSYAKHGAMDSNASCNSTTAAASPVMSWPQRFRFLTSDSLSVLVLLLMMDSVSCTILPVVQVIA